MKLAIAFLATAALVIPVWVLTGCQQNGLWILGIMCAVVGLAGAIAERTPPTSPTHPDSLGSLDLAERAHRHEEQKR